jgi:hypothetical protein
MKSDFIGFLEDLIDNPILLIIIVIIIVSLVLIVISLIKRSKRERIPPIPPEGIECPKCGASLKKKDLHREMNKWMAHCPYCDSDFGLNE